MAQRGQRILQGYQYSVGTGSPLDCEPALTPYHPAEELYFCIAGEAIFKADGKEDRLLSEGGIAQHSSNQSHAMQTNKKPVLAYVVWRNGFDVLPKLTHDDAK